MHLPALCSQALAVLSMMAGLASAHPAVPVAPTFALKPCDDIGKYDTAWFLSNTCKRPPAATCLFYTRGLSEKAKRFSKADGADMTTIWELWPKAQYNKRQVVSNPMRCIMQSKDLRGQYFRSMSKSMAIMCDVFATVMDPNPGSPRTDGIWGDTEYPQLTGNIDNEGKVNQIEGVSPDGNTVEKVWARPSGGKRSVWERDVGGADESEILEKRADCGVDDSTAADFDEGGDYEVLW